MVTEWGMSEKMGPVLYSETENTGHALLRSQETSNMVDAEIKRIVNDAHAEATRILTENRDSLERLAQTLLEYETLTGEEINQILRGETIDRPDPMADMPKPVRSKLPSSRVKPDDEKTEA